MNLHSKRTGLCAVATGLFASLLFACGSGEHKAAEPAPAPQAAQPAAAPDAGIAQLRERAKAIFGPLPAEVPNPKNPITPEKVALGRMLFYDPRLSLSEQISCNTCHGLDHFGVDGEPTSKGHEGQRGARNAPSVYNAALLIAQFWDGRAADVEEQAKGPVLNPIEMAMPKADEVAARLKAIPGYPPLFAAAFPDTPDPVNIDDMALAIAAFERKLMTPGPFDAFLEGDDSALTPAQRAGLATFMDTGCITCHNGPAVGGRMFQKLGLVEPYPTEDVGREKVTGNEADRFVFRVPSLRNVAKTGPWFHDGSITDLDEAIRRMGRYQLGKQLSDETVASIRAFLESLTGKVDTTYIAKPALPPKAGEAAPSES